MFCCHWQHPKNLKVLRVHRYQQFKLNEFLNYFEIALRNSWFSLGHSILANAISLHNIHYHTIVISSSSPDITYHSPRIRISGAVRGGRRRSWRSKRCGRRGGSRSSSGGSGGGRSRTTWLWYDKGEVKSTSTTTSPLHYVMNHSLWIMKASNIADEKLK